MKKVLIIITSVILLGFSNIIYSANVPTSIMKYCQDTWSDTGPLIDMCYDIQFDSFAMYSHYYYARHIIPHISALSNKEIVPQETEIVINCFNELMMPQYDIPDWNLLLQCCEKNIEDLQPSFTVESKFELDNTTYFERYITNMKSDTNFSVNWNGPEYDTYDWSQHKNVFDI